MWQQISVLLWEMGETGKFWQMESFLGRLNSYQVKH